MNKKYIIILFSIFILVVGYFLYNKGENGIPSNPPITVIKYNGEGIPTDIGDYNWIPKNGGNSYLTIGNYTLGEKLTKVDVKSGDIIKISIPHNPLNVVVRQLLDNSYNPKDYELSKSGDDYLFTIPKEKGECIFEIYANWDENHNTSTIFKLNIE